MHGRNLPETRRRDDASLAHTPQAAGGPEKLRAYAVQAAALQGLDIREEWWGQVLMFLVIALEQADLVAQAPVPLPIDPAPVFVP